MKIYFYSFILSIFLFSCSFFAQAYDPLLVVVLMVKNEEAVMRDTLQPFVDAGIDSYLIFDTGSTDETIAVTREFFQEYHVQNGVIKQEPFVDFATSRNRALELAREEFKDGYFMLMPDAEWYMQNVQELIQFCEEHKDDNCLAYLVRIIGDSLDFYTARLIRLNSDICFSGVVHEVLDYCTRKGVPNNIFFKRKSSVYGQEKSRKRWVRDYKLLLNEHERNPEHCRTVFYLAQTCACLGDWENACKWYKHRISMNGWEEENFMALYRLAQAYEHLNKWEKALYYYLEAWAYRPTRVEPLVRLAEYYWKKGDKNLCFLFACKAVELSYPESDVLFIEQDLYNFMRYDLLSRCAWYVGEYEIGELAVRKALQVKPDLDYLQKNLACYVDRS